MNDIQKFAEEFEQNLSKYVWDGNNINFADVIHIKDELLEKYSHSPKEQKPNQRQGGMLGSEDSVRLGKSSLLVNPAPADMKGESGERISPDIRRGSDSLVNTSGKAPMNPENSGSNPDLDISLTDEEEKLK